MINPSSKESDKSQDADYFQTPRKRDKAPEKPTVIIGTSSKKQ